MSVPGPPDRAVRRGAPIVVALALAATLASAAVDDGPVADRIESLRRDARDTSLPLHARRLAAEALLDALRARAAAEASDPRVPIWLADGAEACFITVLPLGGDLDSVLYSLPAHEEWRRVGAAIAVMMDFAERASAAAPRVVSRLSDPGSALRADDRELLDHLETVEIPRRIPLLLGISQALASLVIDAVPEARRERGRAAVARLAPLADALDGEAFRHALSALMIAAGAAGDADSLQRAYALVTEDARGDPSWQLRIEMLMALAQSMRGDPGGAVARLRALSGGPAVPGDEDRPRRLAEFQARLLRDGGAAPGEWLAPLRAAVAAAPRARRSAWRDAILARLTDLVASEPPPHGTDPLLLLAGALAAAREPDAAGRATTLSLEALAGLAPDDPWRPPALELAATLEAKQGRWDESASFLLELAERFRAEPRAPEAIEQAIDLLRAVDEHAADDPTAAHADAPPPRERLVHALEVGLAGYPDHPRRAAWRVERAVIAAEDMVARGASDEASRRSCEESFAETRTALAALADPRLARTLLARQSLALAELALRADRPDDALAALDMAPRDGADLPAPLTLRLRMDRALALALLDRDLLADPVIAASRPRLEEAMLLSMPALLDRVAAPLGLAESRAPDPRRRAAALRAAALMMALIDSVAPPAAPADALRTRLADALRAAGAVDAALDLYDSLLERHPDRADLLLGAAECLSALAGAARADSEATAEDRKRLARAISIYQRLIADRELPSDPALRDELWWLCQLRQLQCHRRAGADRERIAARITRLEALDPTLGGRSLAAGFAQLRASVP